MKKMIIMFFVMFSIAQQVYAMSKPSYGNTVGMQQRLKNLLLKKEIKEVKRQIDERNVLGIFVEINNDRFLVEINEDYNFELNTLAQKQVEVLNDIQRLKFVASSEVSMEDRAQYIPTVISRAKELHGIDIHWLNPKEYTVVMQQCNGNEKAVRNTKEYFASCMEELEAANNKMHKDISNKVLQFQTPEYQQEYVDRKGALLINRELKAMQSHEIEQMIRQDKMNRE